MRIVVFGRLSHKRKSQTPLRPLRLRGEHIYSIKWIAWSDAAWPLDPVGFAFLPNSFNFYLTHP